MDDLKKQLQETTKQYEGKLATLSVFNDALQKENQKLRDELEQNGAPVSATDQEVADLKQEFSKRMASQQKEISRLKAKVEEARGSQGGSNAQARLRDREGYITSLQHEGEALARKNGELEATIRKLRASNRETEAECEKAQARLSNLEKSAAAEKERLEQVAATSTQQVARLQAQYDSLEARATEQIQAALNDGAAAADAARQQAAESGEAALQEALARESQLEQTVASLRAGHEEAESRWSEREEALRREIADIENKLHMQEASFSDAIASTSEGTQPLMREIESMKRTARAQEAVHLETERKLLQALQDLDHANSAHLEEEFLLKARIKQAEANLAAAEAAVSTATRAHSQAEQQLAEERRRCADVSGRLEAAEAEARRAKGGLQEVRGQVEDAKRDLQAQLREAQLEIQNLRQELEARAQPPEPPALPVSTSSRFLDSDGAAAPRVDGNSLRGAETMERRPSSSARAVESMGNHRSEDDLEPRRSGSWQATAGQPPDSRDEGRMRFMNLRLEAAEAFAERANEDLLAACRRAEEAESKVRKSQQTERELRELKDRHDKALEVLGACDLKIRDLEEDIEDMRTIFHTQLTSLVDELNELKRGPQGQPTT